MNDNNNFLDNTVEQIKSIARNSIDSIIENFKNIFEYEYSLGLNEIFMSRKQYEIDKDLIEDSKNIDIVLDISPVIEDNDDFSFSITIRNQSSYKLSARYINFLEYISYVTKTIVLGGSNNAVSNGLESIME